MSIIQIKKEFTCLSQYPTDPGSCTAPQDLGVINGGGDSVDCISINGLSFATPFIVSNADFEITADENDTVSITSIRPSETLQFSFVSSPSPGQIEVRIFRFLCIENTNTDNYLIQTRDEDERQTCITLPFPPKEDS